VWQGVVENLEDRDVPGLRQKGFTVNPTLSVSLGRRCGSCSGKSGNADLLCVRQGELLRRCVDVIHDRIPLRSMAAEPHHLSSM
jgi:hypothetical protein